MQTENIDRLTRRYMRRFEGRDEMIDVSNLADRIYRKLPADAQQGVNRQQLREQVMRIATGHAGVIRW